eukprot:CAMPEP_0173440760 /NCGR_PEP_ID=MMETSP1357-20121228/23566_1 /TAXON_ID=77926 /ORGANISM="Hemiselmis rufescens, Strain PCC563" /LENGTH=150 /DNA_ID=CAMNT_0014406295 /DNA_START=50 /DNA_END=499 /DNA_ORIENTATION=-
MDTLWAIGEGLGLSAVCSKEGEQRLQNRKGDRFLDGLLQGEQVAGSPQKIVAGESTYERKARHKEVKQKASRQAREATQKARDPAELDEDEEELPEGWRMYHSRKSGKVYYRNSKLNLTQWKHPGPGPAAAHRPRHYGEEEDAVPGGPGK